MSNLFIMKENKSPCSVFVKKMEEMKILLQTVVLVALVQGACPGDGAA